MVGLWVPTRRSLIRPAAAGTLVPTTFNPATHGPNIVMTGGNLIVTAGPSIAGYESSASIASHASGKFHFEFTNNNDGGGTNAVMGIADGSWVSSGILLGNDSHGLSVGSGGELFINGVITGAGVETFTTGHTIAIEVDLTAKLFWVETIGGSFTWNKGAGNPAAGTGGFSFSYMTGPFFIGHSMSPTTGHQYTLNTGGSAFAGVVSTGFTAGF